MIGAAVSCYYYGSLTISSVSSLLWLLFFQSSPVNPGWVTYTYEKITTDVLGFKNVGIGMMGLLQGRGAQIQTVYFDDELWIETGKDGAFDYFNVYTREDDDDDWQQS